MKETQLKYGKVCIAIAIAFMLGVPAGMAMVEAGGGSNTNLDDGSTSLPAPWKRSTSHDYSTHWNNSWVTSLNMNVRDNITWGASDDIIANYTSGNILNLFGNLNVTGAGSGNLTANSVDTEQISISKGLDSNYSKYNPFPVQHDEIPVRWVPDKRVENPVMNKSLITDVNNVTHTADPFCLYVNGTYYLFFELISSTEPTQIGVATCQDGYNFVYNQVVLDPTDYSQTRYAYPFVFKWVGNYYMIPDSDGDYSLYKATDFPTEWEEQTGFLTHENTLHDLTPFYYNNRWYCIVEDGTDIKVRLFYDSNKTRNIEDVSWTEHPNSPIADRTYPTDGGAGRPIVYDNYVMFFYKGSQRVNVYKLTDISTSTFNQSLVDSTLAVTTSATYGHWYNGPHHIDVAPYMTGGDIAVADGQESGGIGWEIGILEPDNGGIGYAVTEQTSDQTIGTGYFKVLELGRYIVAKGNIRNSTNHSFEIPREGFYNIKCQLHLADIPSSPTNGFPFSVRIEVRVNGNYTSRAGAYLVAGERNGVHTLPLLECVDELDKGDKVQFRVIQYSGDTISTESGNTLFSITPVT